MTDGRRTPNANGVMLSGNHNDLYQIVRQYAAMIRQLKGNGIGVNNSIQNTDKRFDCKALM